MPPLSPFSTPCSHPSLSCSPGLGHCTFNSWGPTVKLDNEKSIIYWLFIFFYGNERGVQGAIYIKKNSKNIQIYKLSSIIRHFFLHARKKRFTQAYKCHLCCHLHCGLISQHLLQDLQFCQHSCNIQCDPFQKFCLF